MTLLQSLALAASLALTSLPAAADDGVRVAASYALTTGASAAVYLEVENHTEQEDILLSATTDAAKKVTIHHSAENADGVMRMAETTLAVPAQGVLSMQPGRDHIMLMGLTRKLAEGDMITLTLTFQRAGVVTLTVPVTRQSPAAAPATAP